MQFLIGVTLLAVASAQLVTFPNGAVTPYDYNNPVGTTSQGGVAIHPYAYGLFGHYGKREAQHLVAFPNGAVTPYDASNPEGTTSQGGVAIHPYAYGLYPFHYGKREAQVLDPATGLVTYGNGAVAPYDPNVAVATANHYAAKAAHGYYPFLGAAGVHPAATYGIIGRRKREAQLPVNLVTGFTHTPYLGYFGHALGVAPVVSPFVAHPNGALVPEEPEDVVQARADHLAAVAEAGK